MAAVETVFHKVGGGDEDFVAGFEDGAEEGDEGAGGTNGGDDVLGLEGNALFAGEFGGKAGAELGEAGVGHVAQAAGADGIVGEGAEGVAGLLGRGDVGIAEGEVKDVVSAAGLAELVASLEHLPDPGSIVHCRGNFGGNQLFHMESHFLKAFQGEASERYHWQREEGEGEEGIGEGGAGVAGGGAKGGEGIGDLGGGTVGHEAADGQGQEGGDLALDGDGEAAAAVAQGVGGEGHVGGVGANDTEVVAVVADGGGDGAAFEAKAMGPGVANASIGAVTGDKGAGEAVAGDVFPGEVIGEEGAFADADDASLAEFMNLPGLLGKAPDALAKLAAFSGRPARKPGARRPRSRQPKWRAGLRLAAR